MDGGVRSGLDVLKALCSGAKACQIGRAWAYGLAGDGERGVTRVLDIIRAELTTALALTGCTDVSKAGPDLLADTRRRPGRRRGLAQDRRPARRQDHRRRVTPASRGPTMSKTDVSITTRDGVCPAYVFRPAGQDGPWPAAIVYMDALAIRPAMFDLGQRLADHGYYVLVPDLFYRDGPYEPQPAEKLFGDEEARKAIFAKMGKTTNPDAARADTQAFLDFLAVQPDVAGAKVGVTGYCMGGGLALRAAAAFPDRIVAAGAFHPGHLVTDSPDSVHRLAPRIKAKVHVGGADEDAGFTGEHREALQAALSDAGVDGSVQLYAGARHGYVMPDTSVYDEAAAERHWREITTLFDQTLKAA